MKKIFTIASIAILALVSCSKAAPEINALQNEDRVIAFRPFAYVNETKAGESKVAFSTSAKFGAFAYRTAASFDDAGSAALDYLHMNNAEVKYSAPTWAPTTTYYWPKDGFLSFVCYAPYKSASPMTYDLTSGVKFASYSIPAGANEDLMYSDITKDKQFNTDNGQQYQDDAITNGVPVLFHHALSKVNFLFKINDKDDATAEVASVAIDLKSAVINNIKSSGSFAEKPSKAWSSLGDAKSYTIFNNANSPIALSKTASAEGLSQSSFILMPQVLVNTVNTESEEVLGESITVSYHATVTYASKATPVEYDVTETVDLKNTTVPTWGVNKQITYTVILSAFSKDPILFDPAVADWDENINTDVNIYKTK